MKRKKKTVEELECMKVGRVANHFLDSGAFTLWTRARTWATEGKHRSRWQFYESDEFDAYVKGYVAFNKKHSYGIDLCANIDVIPDTSLHGKAADRELAAKLTYDNQKRLEQLGLHPVPVVHWTEDLKWLEKYIKDGYQLIGLGGLVGSHAGDGCREWIDNAFKIVCNNNLRFPIVRLHGFGVTSFRLMIDYPWSSVDSTTWTKKGAYGFVMIPHKVKGEFVFNRQPRTHTLSVESCGKGALPLLYDSMPPMDRKVIREWLDQIGIPLGVYEQKTRKIIENGVQTRHTERRGANLLFFEEMRKHLPDLPWAWTPRAVYTTNQLQAIWPEDRKMVIYYSGDGSSYAQPEILPPEKNVMLTYWNQQKNVSKRFRAILEKRKTK